MPESVIPRPRTKTSCAFGALSDVIKDHLYHAERGAVIYTSPWVVTPFPVRRHAAIFSLSVDRTPFRIAVGDHAAACRAITIKPMVEHAVNAAGVPTIGFILEPSHRHFPRFRRIPAPGLMVLERDAFKAHDSLILAAYHGELSLQETCRLFEDALDIVLPRLPPTKALDPRVERVIDLLWENHDSRLEDLATVLGLSYHRLSHLFADNIGIPLRSYQLWHKVRKAIALLASGQRLIDIAHAVGFADAAHLTNAFRQTHAAPPSFFMSNDKVEIHSFRKSAARGAPVR